MGWVAAKGLVVEDEPKRRAVMASNLSHEGDQVEPVTNVVEAAVSRSLICWPLVAARLD